MGHVLMWTAVTFSAAEDPPRISPHSVGVRFGSMSLGLTPPVPMTTSASAGPPGRKEGAGVNPLIRAAPPRNDARTRKAVAAIAWNACRFTGLRVMGCCT